MNHSKLLAPLSFFLLFTACETKFILPDPPPILPRAVAPTPPRLALVLGGGGAKGMAHVGVLDEFSEANLPIDLIVGCSAGSLVGALYADCKDATKIKKMIKPLKKWDILDINIWYCRYGLVHGRSLQKFLNKNLSARTFEELCIPLWVVVTDLLTGEALCLHKGPLIPALHASSALPLIFSPVVYKGRLLVDGGVADPVPVDIALQANPDVIVAVDLSSLLEKTCPTNLFGIAKRSAEINYRAHSTLSALGATIIIRPNLGNTGLFDDTCHDICYHAGRQAAKEALPKILEALREKSSSINRSE